MKFYDREMELELLLQSEKQAERSAVFTVLTGRRRVGKTSLINKALEGKNVAYLFVSKDSEAVLCSKFQQTLKEQLGIEVFGQISRFRDLFEVIMKASLQRQFTVFFDEFQNLQKVNPAIFSEIQDLWDRYHRESHLHLVASGSIQSLMKHIFEDENEPLYGRPTSKFTLLPFRIEVLKQILRDHSPNYKNEDLLCLYMITGGVAKYVELLMDAQCYTKEKMLNYVCRPDSYFLTEGRDLMSQEFSDESNTYFSVLQLIAAGMKVGSVIRVYLTATDAAWNCQIVDGHWSPNTAFDGCDFNSGNWNLAEHNGAIEFTVTDFIYEHITTAGGWGGSFLLNGDNVICTKVTIE